MKSSLWLIGFPSINKISEVNVKPEHEILEREDVLKEFLGLKVQMVKCDMKLQRL